MKKKIMVMATITIDGENVSLSVVKTLLSKIKKYFRYKYKLSNDDAEIVSIELSDNFIELQ